MVVDNLLEARHHRIEGSIGPDLGGIEDQLLAPDEAGVLAQLDDLIKEAAEDREAQPLPDPGQRRVVWEGLVQVVAEILAVGEVERRLFDELSLRPYAFQHHHELQLEKHDRINTRPAPLRIAVLGPAANKREVELFLQAAVEVVLGHEGFQGGDNRTIKIASLGWTEHGGGLGESRLRLRGEGWEDAG
jgi:hypothetical protein